ncbi:hypothetical protein BCV69DRAFT_314529 [Microstroma glucosiphilum]|uniref:Homeobox domain-containing protein n=1 Tax=Pseudomicrostroma glucosiphilum TaxID=1684307 RepID=A0A316U6Q5_9BASI|nr:hypothetical protein BCV69DRAFT_314529 [Pseudomicrostroma glucosiphilum]PWN18645.1 hypothetical protein BCV69DRAFT_314529 [Pseudomicrostroma glucosiphilum]
MYALPLPLSYGPMESQPLPISGATSLEAHPSRQLHTSNTPFTQAQGCMAVSPLSGSELRSSPSTLGFLDMLEESDLEGGASFSYTGESAGTLPDIAGLQVSNSVSSDYPQAQQQQHNVQAYLEPSSEQPSQSHRPSGRHKCSTAQLAQLSSFFQYTRNPTGKMRAELAQRLGMPERSVRIWFQNKRAKLRAKEAGAEEGLREQHYHQQQEQGQAQAQAQGYGQGYGQGCSNSTTAASSPTSTRTGLSTPYTPSVMLATGTASERVVPARKVRRRKTVGAEGGRESITFLPSYSVTIGTWRRVQPLVCFFSRNARTLTWALKSDSVGFKLELPWGSIEEMSFRGPLAPAEAERAEGVCEPLGVLCVQLTRPPIFSMEVFRSAGKPAESGVHGGGARWRQCEDFTEGKQATSTFMHVLSGPFLQLRETVLALKCCHPDLDEKTHLLDEVSSSVSVAHAQHYRSVDAVPLYSTFNGLGTGGLPQASPLYTQQRPAELPTTSTDYAFYNSSLSAGFAPSHDFSTSSLSASASVEISPKSLHFPARSSASSAYGNGNVIGLGIDLSPVKEGGSMPERRQIAPPYGVAQGRSLQLQSQSQQASQPHWLALAQNQQQQQQQQQQQWQSSPASFTGGQTQAHAQAQAQAQPLINSAKTYVQLFESLPTEMQARQR